MENTHFDSPNLYTRIPYWARSTNPIVRRHLGLYWRTVPPQLQPILIGVIAWALAILAGVLIPFIFQLTMPLIVVSVIAIPGGVILYAHILLSVASNAAQTMSDELRNNTLSLLRTTPMTLQQIFLGKIAASIWRRMDDLMMVAQVIAFFAAPMMVMNVSQIVSITDESLVAVTLVITMMVVMLLRILIEPMMVGALAIMVGAGVPYRSTAMTSSLVLVGFYFLFINLLRYLPGAESLPFFIFINFVLPLVLPLVFTGVALWIASQIITQD